MRVDVPNHDAMLDDPAERADWLRESDPDAEADEPGADDDEGDY